MSMEEPQYLSELAGHRGAGTDGVIDLVWTDESSDATQRTASMPCDVIQLSQASHVNEKLASWIWFVKPSHANRSERPAY